MDLKVPAFKKAPGLGHEIARYLRTAIAEGKLKPGQKLPSEHSLASSFGVSRSVVREAISQLRYEGLIKSFQGLGVFVSETGSPSSFVIDAAALAEASALAQIFELRMTLETDAAALAARRRSKKHLDAMKEALDGMMYAVQHGEDGVAPDIDFHRAIAEATGNQYYASLVRLLNDSIRNSIFVARINTAKEGRDVATNVEAEHKAIFDAIVKKDPVAAANAARAHLRHTAKQLKLAI